MSALTVTAAELGFDSSAQRAIRTGAAVLLLELVRAGHDPDTLARELGVERRLLGKALTRAKVARGERRPNNVSRRDKQALAMRDGGAVCHYCGARSKLGELTVDHVVPLARGGSNARANKVLACRPCNAAKGAAIWVERSVFQ
jgi:hypothetical protein